MPNNGRYTLCPYYRDEKNKSISCEDTFRSFRYPVQKKRWMDAYCDKAWQDCPHAKRLNEMYDRVLERGADMQTEELKLKNESLTHENHSLATRLGKAEKQSKAKDKEIIKLRKQIDKLVEEVDGANRKYQLALNRCKAIDKAREEQDVTLIKYNDQVQATNRLVQSLTAYLMYKLGMEKVYKAGVEKWLKRFKQQIPVIKSDKDTVGEYWYVTYKPGEGAEDE